MYFRHHHLPSEIAAEILARLPVKSVLRFRSVCKTWCTIIDGPAFVSMQLTRASNADSTFAFLFVPPPFRGGQVYLVEPIYYFPNSGYFKAREFGFYFPPTKEYQLRTTHFANGLLCVSSYNGAYFDGIYSSICNPATQGLTQLPCINSPYNPAMVRVISGFGFDNLSEKYKLVIIVNWLEKDAGIHKREVRVFTLGSNSWRILENFPNLICSHKGPASVNGSLHWLTYNDCVLTFDLATEKFGSIQYPKFDNRLADDGLLISNLSGNLCIADYFNDFRLELWIMKDYKMEGSWTKLTVNRGPFVNRPLRPICFSKNGELLLIHDTRILLSYNTQNGRHTLHHFYGIGGLDTCDALYGHEVHPYTGNLLSLNTTC